MALNEREYEVLTFVEMEYSLSGRMPSRASIAERINIKPKQLDALFARTDFRNALLARGLSIKTIDEIESNGIITAEQMMCINTLLDRNDTRSDRKKLAEMGIPTQTYQGWLKDPTFLEYQRQRCEGLFPGMLNEAHRALNDNVAKGDMSAIKLVYEMTGRYSDRKASDLNIDFLLMKVIETIQKHVTDPETLEAIAADLVGYAELAAPQPVAKPERSAPLALVPATQVAQHSPEQLVHSDNAGEI